jgi:hypothetical protein
LYFYYYEVIFKSNKFFIFFYLKKLRCINLLYLSYIKKTKFESLKIGLKKGWKTPTLPKNLLDLQSNPLIRIFRVIGGISALSILTNKINYFNESFLYLAIFICIIYSIYLFYITYYRIKHIFYLLKSKDLDIKNS